MNTELSQQHPQVVLRSRYEQLRAFLAVAAITVVALIAAVVILAVDDSADTVPIASAPAVAGPVVTDTYTGTPGLRFDGGPEEGLGGTQVAPVVTETYTGVPGLRFDGGPEEGGGGTHVTPPAGPRLDGGPDEGTTGPRPDPVPAITRPDEGTRGR